LSIEQIGADAGFEWRDEKRKKRMRGASERDEKRLKRMKKRKEEMR
jgi:hypothetical protein